jgi:hypothetical protein
MTTGSTTTDEEGHTVLLVEDDLEDTSATIMKVWDDGDNRDSLRPAALEVELLADGEPTGKKVTLKEANHWTGTITGLRKTLDGTDIEYTWQEPKVEGYTLTGWTQHGTLTTMTNTHEAGKTEISVEKVWDDRNDSAKKRPASIQVQLYADGRALGEPVTLDEDNEWAYTWEDLDLNVNEDGVSRAIRYTVAETAVPEGYVCRITGGAVTGFVITNTFEFGKLVIEKEFDIRRPETEDQDQEDEELTDIEVEKVWVGDNDDADGNRPESITVRLFAGGTEIRVVKLTAGNGWRYHFGNLPKFVDGRPIHYSVREDPVEGYATEIQGFTIYNKYQPELTQVTVRKVWDDENNKLKIRPKSIWMRLSNGMTVVLSKKNGWTATITGLPAKINGKPAEYTWTEQSVMGYKLVSKVTEGNVTTFTNKPWERPEEPTQGKKPKTPGDTWFVFDDYETPLGVEVVINHVGDCFD